MALHPEYRVPVVPLVFSNDTTMTAEYKSPPDQTTLDCIQVESTNGPLPHGMSLVFEILGVISYPAILLRRQDINGSGGGNERLSEMVLPPQPLTIHPAPPPIYIPANSVIRVKVLGVPAGSSLQVRIMYLL